jgi:hypothetical protein
VIQTTVRYECDADLVIYDTCIMIDPIRQYTRQYKERAVGRPADLCSSYTCLYTWHSTVYMFAKTTRNHFGPPPSNSL